MSISYSVDLTKAVAEQPQADYWPSIITGAVAIVAGIGAALLTSWMNRMNLKDTLDASRNAAAEQRLAEEKARTFRVNEDRHTMVRNEKLSIYINYLEATSAAIGLLQLSYLKLKLVDYSALMEHQSKMNTFKTHLSVIADDSKTQEMMIEVSKQQISLLHLVEKHLSGKKLTTDDAFYEQTNKTLEAARHLTDRMRISLEPMH